MKRKWREISNFDYEVSNDGHVRNKRGKELVPIVHGRSNNLRVCLYRSGFKHWRNIDRLVKDAFGDFKKVNRYGIKIFELEIIETKMKEGVLNWPGHSPLYDMYPGRKAYEMIAKSYGVSPEAIYFSKHGKNWEKFWRDDH